MKINKVRKTSIIALSIIVLSASGCSSLFHPPVDYTAQTSEPLGHLSRVAVASERDTHNMARAVSAVNNAKMSHNQRVQAYYQDTFTTKELARPLTFTKANFLPAAKALKLLFSAADWTFEAIGKKPPIPIMVHLSGANEPIIHYIKDVNSQIGIRATLDMNPASKVAILKYQKDQFS